MLCNIKGPIALLNPNLLILEGFAFLVGASPFQIEAMANSQMLLLRVIPPQNHLLGLIIEVGKTKAHI